MKPKFALLCSLMWLSLFACNSNILTSASAPSPTLQPMASADELRFKDSETGQHFRSLDRCIKTLVDDAWHTTAYQLVGNFYTARWCRGAGARADCQIAGSTLNNRDQRVIELYTLFYERSYPEVFGLGLQSLVVPKSTGWGVSSYFADKGESVVGEGWGVTFREYLTPTGESAATVNLGWSYEYTLPGPNRTTFEYPSDLPVREDLALYLLAPEAMRDRGLIQSLALAQKVTTTIQAHQVNTCDLGPYSSNGIPPVCTPRPLTASEEADELARAKAYFAEQTQLLRDHYQEMYAAWLAAFPLIQCWP